MGAYLLLVVLLPTLLLVLLVFKFRPLNTPYDEVSDTAANALQIVRARHFNEFLGPFSRFDYHHFGPISFYYFAFTEPLFWFLSSDFSKHLLAQLILNYLFLISALHIVYVSSQRRYDCILLFSCILFALLPLQRQNTAFLLWGPAIIILPVLVAILSAAHIASGALRFLLAFAISATFVVQNHESGLVVLAPVTAIASVMFLWQWRARGARIAKTDLFNIAIVLLFVAAAFSPPLYEQFTATGNISKMAVFFASHHGLSHPYAEAASYIGTFYREVLGNLLSSTTILIAAGILSGASVWILRRRQVFNALGAFVFISIPLSIFGATRIPDTLFDYILWYEYGLVALFGFTVLLSLEEVIAAHPFSRGTEQAITAGVFLIALVAIRSFVLAFSPHLVKNDWPVRVMDALHPSKSITYELFFRKGSVDEPVWPGAVGLALRLEKQGYSVCVPDEWTYLFGAALSCEGKRPVVRVELHRTGLGSVGLNVGEAR